ncbi:MAG: CHRD domain-containing protein [Patescibacteria group bacterium]|nr:CHRD domain-containing protein [Patescibacteria group bacterium]
MKNGIIWVIVVVVVGAGIIWFMSQSTEGVPGAQEEQEAPQAIIVSLGEQNDSGMSGFANLTAVEGSTNVVLTLTGAPEGVVQPAHIHTGSCAEIGGVVYPLEFPVNGVSETTLAVSLDAILGQLPLALNVHKSAEEVSVYVACGDIEQ